MRGSPFSAGGGEIVIDPVLGRHVRTGPLQKQAVSNVRRIRDAIASGDRSEAIAFIDFLAELASWNYHQQIQWIDETRQFLRDNGVADTELAKIESDVSRLVTGDETVAVRRRGRMARVLRGEGQARA